MLQLLLRLDTQAVVAMFEELPLLADGAYCGTDDVAAAIAPLGLADLHRLAPHPVLTLRQAVVDAFAALLSRTGLDHGLQGPPPDSGAPAAALPVASGCGGSLAYSAMQFVCGQVARSPPAVVTPGFAAACILRLSSEAPAAAGEGRQSLLATLITATTLDPRDEPTHDGACAILAPALRAMEEAELWGPAAMLHGRLGDFPGQIRCSLQHCQEVCRHTYQDVAAHVQQPPPSGLNTLGRCCEQRPCRRRALAGVAMIRLLAGVRWATDAVSGLRSEVSCPYRHRPTLRPALLAGCSCAHGLLA